MCIFLHYVDVSVGRARSKTKILGKDKDIEDIEARSKTKTYVEKENHTNTEYVVTTFEPNVYVFVLD